eukprot:1194186-Prorocentrum_minimum.AAC.1
MFIAGGVTVGWLVTATTHIVQTHQRQNQARNSYVVNQDPDPSPLDPEPSPLYEDKEEIQTAVPIRQTETSASSGERACALAT